MTVTVLHGDCREVLRTLEPESVHCVVTSPPYFGLRDYGVAGQIGLEPTPDEYIAELVAVFAEVRRVLRKDGVVFLNLGDSYAASQTTNGGYSAKSTLAGFTSPDTKGGQANETGSRRPLRSGAKPKDLLMIPARVALALQADGWWLRSDIIWSKPNPMPESVTDRPTSAHEHVFLLARSERYFFDADAVREPNCEIVQRAAERYANNPDIAAARARGNLGAAPDRADSTKTLRISNNAFANTAGRNIRNVWTIATSPYPDAHFATFPPELAERCIKAGCPKGGTVLDPFGGAGTTGLVADRLQRNAILIELNGEYVTMAQNRVRNDAPLFA